jgi:ligand-binding sensor domain-containing protein
MRTRLKSGCGGTNSSEDCIRGFWLVLLETILGLLGIALCLTCGVQLCAQTRDRTLSQYSERLYTTEQGLPQNEVRSIAQTPDGYLWFGTRDGLARFDGVRFSIFRQETTPGIGHNMFGAMLVDHLGRLWIATGDGLSCYGHGGFKRYTEKDGLPANAVHTLLEDHSGKLWIGTWNGLAVFDGTHFRTLTKRDGLPANAIAGLAEDGNGGLWIGTYGGGVAHMVDGHFSLSTEKDGLPADFIQTIFRDHNGRLWVGTLKGAALLTSAGRFETVPSLPGKSICFYEDRNGTVWAATDKTFARLTSSGSVFERQRGAESGGGDAL